MVMEGDSCSKDRGFESRRQILYGHDIFSHRFVVKIVLFVERPKINEKEAAVGPFFLKKPQTVLFQRGDSVEEINRCSLS